MEHILLSLVDDNPYNARLAYDDESIRDLARSISNQGLLTPVMVRRSGERFQLVFGHRRVRALRLLNLERIKAEVSSFSDVQMLEFSLVENLQRKDLSDYEKGLTFARMNSEFGLSLGEIASTVGCSKQHVCNYVRMTELFDDEFLSKHPSVSSDLHKISEHHSRLLLQIRDQQTRANTLRLVMTEKFSVRDLERIVHRFRGWFTPGNLDIEDKMMTSSRSETRDERDRLEIKRVLMGEFELPKEGDFPAFESRHAFDQEFSLFTSIPPLQKYSRGMARARERLWFDRIMPERVGIVRNLKIQVMGDSALATLYLDFYDKSTRRREWADRGTVVFVRVEGGWKIIHEHWSPLEENRKVLRIK